MKMRGIPGIAGSPTVRGAARDRVLPASDPRSIGKRSALFAIEQTADAAPAMVSACPRTRGPHPQGPRK
jgi:hypothetical protein